MNFEFVVPLAIVNPQNLCECFGLKNDVVTNDELDGYGFDELIDAGWRVVFRRGVEVCFA